METGFLFTTWQMIVSPGLTVKNFIDGKRRKYQKPVSFLLIWIAVYVLLLLFIEKVFGNETVLYRSKYFGTYSATQFAAHYLSVVLGALLPFYSLYLYLLCMKKYYNYFESFVAILYGHGIVLLTQVLFTLFAITVYLFSGHGLDVNLSDSLKVVYITWFCYKLVGQYDINHRWWRVIGFMTLCLASFYVWRMFGFPLLANLH